MVTTIEERRWRATAWRRSYSELSAKAYLGNFIGVFMLLTGLTVVFVVTKAEYKRRPLPEEEPITYSLQ